MGMGVSEKGLEGMAFLGDTLGPMFYHEPFTDGNASLYEAFKSLDPSGSAAEWPFGNEAQIEEGLSKIRTCLSNGDKDEIVWEYRRLFVGPAKKAAPPWGSVYTDKDQVIFGASTLELRKWMREIGVSTNLDQGEPEDHLGLMLSMMSWLAKHKPDALPEFLAKHLLTWSGHFLDYMRASTESDLFEGLAMLTKTSLEGIRETLGIQVETPRFYR